MNNSNGHTFAKQWRREHCAKAHCNSTRLGTGKFSLRRGEVGYMDRLAIDNRSAKDRIATDNAILGCV